MDPLKRLLTRRRSLSERVRVLESEIQECRQLNVRLAELCDVVTELLLPAADRDEAALTEVLERYRADIGDPLAR
ncbi:DUF6752 domain-containing protein [Nocardioides sp. URHA0020]|uniref:DUF6752 domain-containing protein n=1 Tax=Nocardioides sp. URHA0020 TaxID=1380392 RepID=UPI000ABDEC0D|nr:DUF6752 domain-containing protein [Nocardioides sp. URHA0020]